MPRPPVTATLSASAHTFFGARAYASTDFAPLATSATAPPQPPGLAPETTAAGAYTLSRLMHTSSPDTERWAHLDRDPSSPVNDVDPDAPVPGEGRPGSGDLSRRTFRRVAALLAAAAAVWTVAGSLWLFPGLSENSDEGAYLAQADALAHGSLGMPAPPQVAAAIRPWLSVVRNGEFVFKYTPPHAAALAASLRVIGTARGALPLFAAVAVIALIAFARQLGATRKQALMAGALLVLSPVFVVQSATFLPYLASLAAMLAAGALALSSLRTASVPAGVAAGLFFGWVCWLRPFDALLVGIPFAVYAAIDGRGRSSKRRRPHSRPVARRRTVGAIALGMVPGVVGFFAYNLWSTGSPFQLPFQLLNSADTLGFGSRRMQATDPFVQYDVGVAWRGLVANSRLITIWSAGGLVLVLVAVFGAVHWSQPRSRRYLVATVAAWVGGYFVFWGSFSYVLQWDGGRFLGPYYYLPVLAVMVIFAGRGLDFMISNSRRLGLFTVAVMCVISVPLFAWAFETNLARTAKRESVQQALPETLTNTLVLLPPVYGQYIQHPFSFWRNSRGSSQPVFAIDGPDSVEVARYFRGRRVIRLTLPDGYPNGDKVQTVRAETARLSLQDAPSFVISHDAAPGSAESVLRLAANGGLAVDLPVGAQLVATAVGDRLSFAVVDASGTRSIVPARGGDSATGTLDLEGWNLRADGSAINFDHLELSYSTRDGSVRLLTPDAGQAPPWSITPA
jgi:hypothetical protein